MKGVDLLQLPAQKFCLTHALKQNLQILQMSQIELLQYIENEIDLNPCLKKKSFPKSPIDFNFARTKSLCEDLMEQAACILSKSEQKIAYNLFGNLSKEGFLPDLEVTDEILLVLKKIQMLEPAGICALNLKDSLLIQLKRKKKEKTLAYQIIEKSFNDFIYKRWKKIAKDFHISISKINEIIVRDLSKLCLRPAEKYLKEKTFYPSPDMYIRNNAGNLEVSLNQRFLPIIALNEDKNLELFQLQKIYKNKAKMFIENLYKRDNLLLKIGKYLIKEEKDFFSGRSDMKLLAISKLAKFCNVHESTIHRCIKNKYLYCISSIMPLKRFFKGQTIPETQLLNSLKQTLATENKSKPLSDLKIMQELKKLDIDISRRTVAKYREKLKILPARFRKTL